MSHRRSFLRIAFVGCSALALAACTSSQLQQATTVSAKALTYVGAFGTAFASLGSNVLVTGLVGVSSAIVSEIEGYFSQAQTILSGINSATTQAQGQTTFQQAETFINQAEALATPYLANASTGVKTLFAAISAALPVTLAAIQGLVGTSAETPPPILTMQNAKAVLAAG